MSNEEQRTHFGYQQVPVQEKAGRVGRVFDSVAERYNLMNDLMSLGVHRLWKQAAVAECHVRPGQSILDLAGGTGDMTRLIHPKLQGQGQVVLADINATMLQEGRRLLTDLGLVSLIDWVQANAESLPFPDHRFHTAIMAFGLRNVTHKDRALAGIHRVLRPGGRLVVLEFSQPNQPTLKKLYDAYSFYALPLLGRLICNDAASYQYLAESIRMHPNQESLKTLMEDTGFARCTYRNWSGGIVAIHTGFKL